MASIIIAGDFNLEESEVKQSIGDPNGWIVHPHSKGPCFTRPNKNGTNSRIDYILSSAPIKEMYTIEHSSKSDHLPVKALIEVELEYNKPIIKKVIKRNVTD